MTDLEFEKQTNVNLTETVAELTSQISDLAANGQAETLQVCTWQ